MKEVTDTLKTKIEDKVQDLYTNQEGVSFRYGDHRFQMPEKVFFALEEKMRYYETENVDDIRKNYSALSKTSRIPFSVIWWILTKMAPELAKDPAFKNKSRIERKEYLDLTYPSTGRGDPNITMNLTSLENVYLDNLRFIKRRSFEACEMDIMDKDMECINGIFVYQHVPYQDFDDLNKEQLGKALGAPQATLFDIIFTAMPEDYVVERFGIKSKRGKKLHIQSIKKNKGKDEEPIMPFIDKFSGTPTLQLVR